jgi:hypothetical protein
MSKSAKRARRTKRLRFTMTGIMIVLLAPVLMLALAPVLLMFVPIALVLLPFMLATFFSSPHARAFDPRLIRVEDLPAWQPAPAFQV